MWLFLPSSHFDQTVHPESLTILTVSTLWSNSSSWEFDYSYRLHTLIQTVHPESLTILTVSTLWSNSSSWECDYSYRLHTLIKQFILRVWLFLPSPHFSNSSSWECDYSYRLHTLIKQFILRVWLFLPSPHFDQTVHPESVTILTVSTLWSNSSSWEFDYSYRLHTLIKQVRSVLFILRVWLFLPSPHFDQTVQTVHPESLTILPSPHFHQKVSPDQFGSSWEFDYSYRLHTLIKQFILRVWLFLPSPHFDQTVNQFILRVWLFLPSPHFDPESLTILTVSTLWSNKQFILRVWLFLPSPHFDQTVHPESLTILTVSTLWSNS